MGVSQDWKFLVGASRLCDRGCTVLFVSFVGGARKMLFFEIVSPLYFVNVELMYNSFHRPGPYPAVGQRRNKLASTGFAMGSERGCLFWRGMTCMNCISHPHLAHCHSAYNALKSS
eukprot:scaffold648026_cov44-Prasinocladus_malaysianus.AAC.1